MPTTSTKIVFSFGSAQDIKEGSTPAIDDVISQCDLTDLATGDGVDGKWATFEDDVWLLDGNYHLIPETAESAHVGVFSETITDENGDFDTPPELTIQFDDDYDLAYGITLNFSSVNEIYCNDLDIEFYDDGDSLLDSDNYTPDDYIYFCELPSTPIEDINYIVITFNSLNEGYKHLRLVDIGYDVAVFQKEDIKSANILQEVMPISTELPMGTLEFTLHSDDDDFNIVDPQGFYAQLQYKQELDVYEYIDGISTYLGKFYLDKWDTDSFRGANFTAFDAMGILDKTMQYGDMWGAYNDAESGDHEATTTVSTLVAAIFTLAGLDYDLDASLNAVVVSGYVPPVSCREALQQIAFMAQATVRCSRDGMIEIYPTVLAQDIVTCDYELTDAEKSSEQSLNLLPVISALNLHYHSYVPEDGVTQIFGESLAADDYIIIFSQPYQNNASGTCGVTGATPTDYSANHEEITVGSPGNVTIEGSPYRHSDVPYLVEAVGLPDSSKANILEISDATLVNIDNVEDLADHVFDYYSQRYLFKLKLFGYDVEVGKSALIDTIQSNTITSVIEKVETDLIGFVSKIEARGVVTGG